jgi:phosphohistidine phosphatase
MELYLLRHAHAGDPGAWDGPDERRPLSDKGEKQSERLGRFLAGIGFRVDAVITSPKVRAAQTARIVAGALSLPVGEDDRLGGEVGLETLESTLRDAGDPARAMIVGHDPDFTDLVTILCGAASVPMKKGALARIDVDRPLQPGTGTLRWLVPPDLLRPDR